MNKNNTEPASFILRGIALSIDSSVWLIVFSLMVFTISQQNRPELILNALIGALTFVFLFSILYSLFISWTIATFGGSIGKLICGLEVVNEKGDYLTFKQAFLRTYVGYVFSSLFLWAGCFWALRDKEHLTWHDMMIGSRVLRYTHYGKFVAPLVMIAIITLILALIMGSAIQFQANSFAYKELGEWFWETEEYKQNDNLDYEAGEPARLPVSERKTSIPI